MDRGIVTGHATIGIMATLLLVLVVVLVIGGLVYGVVSLLSGDDPGLVPAEPDGRARPLPNDRSLHEDDLKEIRFDVALRGYRMAQVDRMLRRVAYDLGYKDEMIAVLEAEVAALREGRREDAELLRKAREAAATPDRDTPDRDTPDRDTTPGSNATPGPDITPGPVGSPESVINPGEVTPADSGPSTPGPGERPAAHRGEDGHQRTDDPAEPELPREGSLRRREPVAAAADPVAVDTEGTDGPVALGAPDGVALGAADGPVTLNAADGPVTLGAADGPVAADMADRPAHA